MSDTSGKSLTEHWTWAAEKGLMNQNTAIGLRAAVTKVLSVEENPDEVDIKTINVDDILRRFENLKKKEFTPGSLETYKSRFRQAIKSYLAYLDDPGAWRPAVRERQSPPDRNGTPRGKSKEHSNGSGPELPQQPQPAQPQKGRVIDYPFPLREDVIAHLWLPMDLKPSEAKRLTAFMSTLLADPEPA